MMHLKILNSKTANTLWINFFRHNAQIFMFEGVEQIYKVHYKTQKEYIIRNSWVQRPHTNSQIFLILKGSCTQHKSFKTELWKIGPRDLCSLARIILCIVLPFIWYAAILGSVEPVLRGAWAPVEPVLCGACAPWSLGLRGAWAPRDPQGSTDPQTLQIHRLHGSTIPQFNYST